MLTTNWRFVSDEYEKSDFLYEMEEPDYGYVEGCKSVCGKYGSLWPKPTGTVELSQGPIL
jgi:hypothetical protein